MEMSGCTCGYFVKLTRLQIAVMAASRVDVNLPRKSLGTYKPASSDHLPRV
jgi:hypothetical protein